MNLKLGTILFCLFGSLLILVPSFVPENSKLQKYLPSKRINLGLDLRGGIHVVLGVDIQKALDVELDKFALDLQEQMKEKNIPAVKVDRDRTEKSIVVQVSNLPDIDSLETLLKDRFYQILAETYRDGTKVHLQLDEQYSQRLAQMSLEQAKEIIRNRVDEFGVAEPIIQIQGTDRILVQLPGVQDPDRALQLIGRTALLEFKMVDETLNPSEVNALVEKVRDSVKFKNNFTKADLEKLNVALKADLPAGTEISFEKKTDPRSKEVNAQPFLLKSQTVLTGGALEDSRVVQDPNTNRPEVSLKFSKMGAEAFEKITEANVGKRLAILLDGVVMSDPVIKGKIPAVSAGASITLGSGNINTMRKEAQDLSLVLRSGALPAPVEILENRTVGASLGEDSIKKGQLSTVIGALLVILFMVLYYRWSGFVANIALVINIVMLMAIMALFQATLTLPGIAGIVLTIGMAVDANVVIIERIREELRAGKRIQAAIEAGYHNANRAIIDAHVTTVASGIVLYNFGSGPIRGFAVTLIVGLVCNYIAAVWFTHWIYHWYLNRYPVQRLSV